MPCEVCGRYIPGERELLLAFATDRAGLLGYIPRVWDSGYDGVSGVDAGILELKIWRSISSK